MPHVKIKPADYELAAEYYNTCMGNGIQGSQIDFLICALSVRNKFEIYTKTLQNTPGIARKGFPG
jgi:hypothetical protein